MMYLTIGPKTISKQPSLKSLNTLLKRADDGGCRIPLKYILNKPDVFTVDHQGDLGGGWGLEAKNILLYLLCHINI